MHQDRAAALIRQAGYADYEPILVSLQYGTSPPVFARQGAISESTIVYIASLSKQLTAACAALHGLDMDEYLSRWLPELPAWAGTVRLRHLVHHTGALPDDNNLDWVYPGAIDCTSTGLLHALAQVPTLPRPPGSRYAYSNAGYVCLATAIERAVGSPLPMYARDRLFAPLAMADTCFWSGPEPAPPGAAPLAKPHPAPLSLGDGGVWSTALDLLRWSRALNSDELGISALLQTPGRLDNGELLDYAWGTSVRSQAGHPVYRHGGGWPGLRTLLARSAELDLSLLIIATADDTERRVDLANAILNDVAPAPSG